MNASDIRNAFAFLTILPVGEVQGQPGRSFAWFPLVGLVIGILLALTMTVLDLAPDLEAGLALGLWIVLTGGLHLDGFSDTCDGLLATTNPERRLEIMKDPRTGSWAVIGLVMLLLVKWLSIREISPWLLLIAPILGRWAMVLAAYSFPYARPTGLGAYFRQGLERQQVIIATGFTFLVVGVAALFYGYEVLFALMFIPLFVLLGGRWAASRLGGGLTGDVYGAFCELTELVCLVILSAA